MSRIMIAEPLERRQLLASGLTAQYFDNKDFTSLKLTRIDAQVNFNWGSGSPASSIAPDSFSVRWTGQVKASKTAAYTFHTTSDDGVRLWVNGKLVIDKFTDHKATSYSSAPITLTAGQAVAIQMDYYDNAGNASAKLMWSSDSIAKQVIPSANLISSGVSTPAYTKVTWKSVAASPVERAEANGAVVNGKVYIFGGYYSAEGKILAYSRCDVYDPATNKWTRLKDMPAPFTHSGMAVDGSTVWMVGQYIGDHPGPGSEQVWKYNTLTDSWSRGPDLPQPRGAGAAAILGRELHFFGGMDETRTLEKGDHWVLNLEKISAGWVAKAAMPNPRNHLNAAVVSGKIYAIGGQYAQEEKQVPQSEVDCYDPKTNKWTKVASLPAPRSQLSGSVFVLNGRIMVMGGEAGFMKQQDTIYSYDPALNRWSLFGRLPAKRSTAITGLIDANRIVVATGNNPDETRETWIGTLS